MKMRNYQMSRILFATALLSVFAATADAQSLAGLAKKTEGAKTATPGKAPGKVYTNDDVAAADVPAVSPAEAISPAGSAPVAESTPGAKADETSWRKRMKALRAQSDQSAKACAPKAALVARLSSFLDATTTTTSVAVVGTDLIKARSDLNECQDKMESDRAAIADAQEEGRRQGALPGWLR
jgi:hypothetical protein